MMWVLTIALIGLVFHGKGQNMWPLLHKGKAATNAPLAPVTL
jgi:hypothetical protein